MGKKAARRGAPTKKKLRDKQLPTVMVYPEEISRWKAAAKSQGLRWGQWVRAALDAASAH